MNKLFKGLAIFGAVAGTLAVAGALTLKNLVMSDDADEMLEDLKDRADYVKIRAKDVGLCALDKVTSAAYATADFLAFKLDNLASDAMDDDCMDDIDDEDEDDIDDEDEDDEVFSEAVEEENDTDAANDAELKETLNVEDTVRPVRAATSTDEFSADDELKETLNDVEAPKTKAEELDELNHSVFDDIENQNADLETLSKFLEGASKIYDKPETTHKDSESQGCDSLSECDKLISEMQDPTTEE